MTLEEQRSMLMHCEAANDYADIKNEAERLLNEFDELEETAKILAATNFLRVLSLGLQTDDTAA